MSSGHRRLCSVPEIHLAPPKFSMPHADPMFRIRSNRRARVHPTRRQDGNEGNLSPFHPQPDPDQGLPRPGIALRRASGAECVESRSRGPPVCRTTIHSARTGVGRKWVNARITTPGAADRPVAGLCAVATRGVSSLRAARKSQSESVKKFLAGDSRPEALTQIESSPAILLREGGCAAQSGNPLNPRRNRRTIPAS